METTAAQKSRARFLGALALITINACGSTGHVARQRYASGRCPAHHVSSFAEYSYRLPFLLSGFYR